MRQLSRASEDIPSTCYGEQQGSHPRRYHPRRSSSDWSPIQLISTTSFWLRDDLEYGKMHDLFQHNAYCVQDDVSLSPAAGAFKSLLAYLHHQSGNPHAVSAILQMVFPTLGRILPSLRLPYIMLPRSLAKKCSLWYNVFTSCLGIRFCSYSTTEHLKCYHRVSVPLHYERTI